MDRVAFESPHFPISGGQREAVARALERMPRSTYARAGTHTPALCAAIPPRASEGGENAESFEGRSFAAFKACQERKPGVSGLRWWAIDDMLHAYGWGNWDRTTQTGVCHVFFCDAADSDAAAFAVRDFVREAFPRRTSQVVARDPRVARAYRAGLIEPVEHRDGVGLATVLSVMQAWPDVLVLDGVLDGAPCDHVLALVRQPLTFVFVFRGPGPVRAAVEADAGRAPRHVPRLPDETELEELRGGARRASGAAAGPSGRVSWL